MQSSAENLHYVFDIGDHPTVVTCLPIAAESFKLKSGLIVQMDGRKAKSSVNSYFRIVLRRCC